MKRSIILAFWCSLLMVVSGLNLARAQNDADFVWQKTGAPISFLRQSATVQPQLSWFNSATTEIETAGANPVSAGGGTEPEHAVAGLNVNTALRGSTHNGIVTGDVVFHPDNQPLFGASAIINSNRSQGGIHET